ncbi:MAG: serine hydrolase [Flavobacteriales bacterium]|nr:serine hydrolase [Flavobacteriales bacterium]
MGREKAHTEHLLTDGSATHYGYGWSMMNVQGSRTIEHGGGINGFVSRSLYLPEEDIYVAVLTNRESDDASTLAPTLAAIAMGKLYAGTVVPWIQKSSGVHRCVHEQDRVERYITADEKGMHSQRQGSSVRDLDHLGNDRFLAHGDVITFTFQRTDGKVTGALLRTRQSEEQLTRTDKPLPTRTGVTLERGGTPEVRRRI